MSKNKTAKNTTVKNASMEGVIIEEELEQSKIAPCPKFNRPVVMLKSVELG